MGANSNCHAFIPGRVFKHSGVRRQWIWAGSEAEWPDHPGSRAVRVTANAIGHSGNAWERLGTVLGKNPEDRDMDTLTSALSDIGQTTLFAPPAGPRRRRFHSEQGCPRTKCFPEAHSRLRVLCRIKIKKGLAESLMPDGFDRARKTGRLNHEFTNDEALQPQLQRRPAV